MKQTISILLLIFLLSCKNQDSKNLNKITSLPKSLNEISGITMIDDQSIYAINDSGNKNILYRLNLDGEIIDKIKIKDSKNKDWEDLAYDNSNNIYIGDFGNNSYNRKKMTIYKVSEINTGKPITTAIEFTLEKYKSILPFIKGEEHLDFEALICFNEQLYLFTKNKGKKSKEITRVYRLSCKPGKQIAKLVSTYKEDNKKTSLRITAAAINRNGNQIALLTHDKVILLSNFKGDAFFDGKIKKINLKHKSQKEGICFKNAHSIYITDEKTKHTKATLYEYKL